MDTSELFIGWALSTLFTLLGIVIKNPEKKKQYKKAMIKLRNQLLICYPPDQDDATT